MHRIDTPGHLFNRFTVGNPQTGQRATRLGADWPNEVQEEIISVLTLAGILPVKGVATQLRDAIVAVVAGAVGTGGGAVPTTRQVNGGGLVTGGGPLSGDLTLSVAKALAADVLAGVLDTAVITPLQLATAIGNGAAGVVRLPGGRIEMTGSGFVGANSTTLVSLPASFPVECRHVSLAGGWADFGAEHNNPFVDGQGTGTFSVFNSANAGVSFTYCAIGR